MSSSIRPFVFYRLQLLALVYPRTPTTVSRGPLSTAMKYTDKYDIMAYPFSGSDASDTLTSLSLLPAIIHKF